MSYFIVAHYTDRQAYGGPEEGGWWYTESELQGIVDGFRSEQDAYDKCYAMNTSEYRGKGEHYEVVELGKRMLAPDLQAQQCHSDLDGVYDEDGHILPEFMVTRWAVPEHLPEYRPHYC